MSEKTSTLYANVFGLRTTERELILEFGCFFPTSEAEAKIGPDSIKPDIRVVMALDAIKQITDALVQLRDAAKK